MTHGSELTRLGKICQKVELNSGRKRAQTEEPSPTMRNVVQPGCDGIPQDLSETD